MVYDARGERISSSDSRWSSLRGEDGGSGIWALAAAGKFVAEIFDVGTAGLLNLGDESIRSRVLELGRGRSVELPNLPCTGISLGGISLAVEL